MSSSLLRASRSGAAVTCRPATAPSPAVPLISWIHNVPCPTCRQPIGELCRQPAGRYDGGHITVPAHPTRRTLAIEEGHQPEGSRSA